MTKRGRPPKKGAQPGWMLHRIGLALDAYNDARNRGEKHSAAVREAVANVKSRISGMPISETVVKRILAEYQPEGIPVSLRVSRPTEPEAQRTVDEYKALGLPGTPSMVLTLGFGPRPKYPRHNAKAR